MEHNGDPPWEDPTDGKIFGGMEDEDALTIWYFEADNVLRAFCPPGELKAGLAKVLSLLKPGG